jgi:hypothetical protein
MSVKEYIQNSADEVAIVIYDAPLPPKYFRLTKRFIKTLFIAAPLFILLLLGGLFFWGLGSRLKEAPAPTLPTMMSESESKIYALETEIKSLQESNKELIEKVAGAPSVASPEDPYLMLIKKPYGMQNLLSQNKVSLDQFELIQKNNKINLKFQIISSSPEKRVTGHVLVFMISEAGLLGYPKEINALIGQGLKYSNGETFSVSRLRPTDAEFPQLNAGKSVKFIVYIFNREGDLLLIQETQPFKVENQS